jgi:putative ABC transport system ATP-binding protein
MSEAAIEVRGVVKRFGDRTVLDGLDLRVEAGAFVAVSGHSGAGKSTLLQLLAAVDRPDAGTISVRGVDVTHLHQLTRYRRRDIGLIFQLHNLVPRLDAAQNVEIAMFGTGLRRRERRARALDLLDAVGLADRASARPPNLSGGERQRVAIARALANRPPVLLADEPTGSLDDESADQVLDVLSERCRDDGVTILAVTHDPRLDERATGHVRLERGRIIET